MTNIAETSPNHAEEILRTRFYKVDLATLKKAVEEIIPKISTKIWGGKWKIVNFRETAANAAIIEVEVPVVFFTDDLKIDLKQDGAETAVNLRSASRVGKSDLGENRRHILQVLEALDAHFRNAKS